MALFRWRGFHISAKEWKRSCHARLAEGPIEVREHESITHHSVRLCDFLCRLAGDWDSEGERWTINREV